MLPCPVLTGTRSATQVSQASSGTATPSRVCRKSWYRTRSAPQSAYSRYHMPGTDPSRCQATMEEAWLAVTRRLDREELSTLQVTLKRIRKMLPP
eukprot:794253-Rhodomonas_salina.1